MKKSLFIICYCILWITSYSQSNKLSFFKKVNDLGLFFMLKSVYKEIPITQTSPVTIDYAVTNPTGYEIRYKVVPIPSSITNDKLELFYKANVTAIVLDIGGAPTFKFHQFPKDAVKNDVNGDYGGEGYMKDVNASFSKESRNVYMVSFCKINQAIIYVFLLFDKIDNPDFANTVQDTYKAIRFINAPGSGETPTGLGNASESELSKIYRDSLHATDEQISKIIDIAKKYANKSREIRNDSSLSKPDRVRDLMKLMLQKNDEIKKNLNEGQFAIWERWQRADFRRNLPIKSLPRN